MRHDRLTRSQSFSPAVDLDKLWNQVCEQTRGNAAGNRSGAAPIIEGGPSGYYQVVGRESSRPESSVEELRRRIGGKGNCGGEAASW